MLRVTASVPARGPGAAPCRLVVPARGLDVGQLKARIAALLEDRDGASPPPLALLSSGAELADRLPVDEVLADGEAVDVMLLLSSAHEAAGGAAGELQEVERTWRHELLRAALILLLFGLLHELIIPRLFGHKHFGHGTSPKSQVMMVVVVVVLLFCS